MLDTTMNGASPGSDSEAATAAADPRPADLIALVERLFELGNERGTVENLAVKLGMKPEALRRLAEKDQPFSAKHLAAARAWESNLQAQIEQLEAERGDEPEPESEPEPATGEPTEPEDGQDEPSGGEGSAEGKRAAGEAQADADEDDYEEEWERRQREHAAAQRLRGDEKDAALIERFEEALARLERATPRPPGLTGVGLVVEADGLLKFDENYHGPSVLQPKITDRLTRGDLAATIAAPNVGKTTHTFNVAQAIVQEDPALIGQARIDWCGPVLIVSNEDVPTDGAARWREQRKHLKLAARAKHELFIWPERLTLARFQDNTPVPTEAGCEFVETLAARAEKGIHYAYIVLDPFSGLFPGITENNPTEMGDAAYLCKRIAVASFAAVELVHHTKKDARNDEKIDAYRGGSGFEGVVDELSTLVVLSVKDVVELSLPASKAGRILRLMAQRKRRGAWAETYYFERVVLDVAAIDSRRPNEIAAEKGTVAIMVSIPPPAKKRVDLDVAQRALWDEHQTAGGKGKLTRGGKGSGPLGTAVQIVMEKCDCDRPAAEVAVDELAKLKRVKIDAKYPGGKSSSRRLIVTPEPPIGEGGAEDGGGEVESLY